MGESGQEGEERTAGGRLVSSPRHCRDGSSLNFKLRHYRSGDKQTGRGANIDRMNRRELVTGTAGVSPEWRLGHGEWGTEQRAGGTPAIREPSRRYKPVLIFVHSRFISRVVRASCALMV